MSWLPGWDSVEESGWWGNFHFWFGIVCLFLLCVTEVLSHLYGLRKDNLVSANEINVSDQHTKETNAIRKQLEDAEQVATEAQQKIAKLQRQSEPRSISNDEKSALAVAISPFVGQKIVVFDLLGDTEGAALASGLIESIRRAGWDDGGGTGLTQGIFTGPQPVGVEVIINDSETQKDVWHAAQTLARELVRLGFMLWPQIGLSQEVQNGQIKLVIGTKPPQ